MPDWHQTFFLLKADDAVSLSEAHAIKQAKAAWDSGAMAAALEILDQSIQEHPGEVILHKLRGDILATYRGPHEAVQAYEMALAAKPSALDVRWAKWGLLVRWGKSDEALRNYGTLSGSTPTTRWFT